VFRRRSLVLLVFLLVPALLAVPFVAGWLQLPLESFGGGPMAGWKRFKTADLSLDLPTSYSGGATSGADLDEVVGTLKGVGTDDSAALADAIQQGRTQFAFWAFDLDSLSASRFPTGVSIASDTVIVDGDVGLPDLARLLTQKLPPQFDVKESEPVQIGNLEGHRLKILTHSMDEDVEQAMYLVRHGDTIWKITFATPASQFDTQFTTFEQSVQSLALN
jgi:hypothetical protein